MPRFPKWTLGLFSLMALTCAAQFSQQSLIPSEHNPLYLLFNVPAWQPLDDRQAGDKSLAAYSHYSNIFEWRANDRFVQDFDGEMGSLNLIGDWALSTRTSIAIEWGAHRFSGGFLDSAIQSFHDTFNFANDDRDLVEDNRRMMRLIDSSGNILFEADPHEWHMDNPQMRIRRTLPTRGSWHANLGFSAKIPIGSGPFHNDHWDIGLDFHARFQRPLWRFDFQVGLLTLHAPEALEPISRDAAAYGKLWAERLWFKRLGTFVEFNLSSPYFENTGLDTLDPEAMNFIVGLSWATKGRTSWVLTFGEDISAQGPALDFHVNLGATISF